MSVMRYLPRCGPHREWQFSTLLARRAEWRLEDERLVHDTNLFVECCLPLNMWIIGHNDVPLFSVVSEQLTKQVGDFLQQAKKPNVSGMDVVLKCLLAEEEAAKAAAEEALRQREREHYEATVVLSKKFALLPMPTPPVIVKTSSWTGR